MKKATKVSSERALLLRLVDEGYDKAAWHGPNLKAGVRRVPALQAAWRPKTGKHNIAEIAVHCAYWKYAVRRRILGEKRGSFPLKGSNWLNLPTRLTDKNWREYLKLLDETHAALREAIATAPWTQLTKAARGRAKEVEQFVYGIAMHDTYHAGQIRTLKGLYKKAAKS